ncbi:MAG: response regulator [Chitinivibrionales bacterium]|nr:response regulator [Chitinivibrionales bacterium]
MHERILLVDDEPDLLDILGDFLQDLDYTVTCASNGGEALAALEQSAFDLLLSDINMPGMKGFELLEKATSLYPRLKTALITAYDVRDYMRLAREYNIGNIIAKTTPFNFDEIELLLKNIISESVFGLERYVTGKLNTFTLSHSNQIEDVMKKILDDITESRHKRKFRQALGEILVNAVYYGAKNEQGDKKNEWEIEVALDTNEEVFVTWGTDNEKAGVAVRDQKGRLTKQEVLHWLERNTTKNEEGLSLGLFDEHGKGLYISRESIDRFIVNIKRNQTTEIVMLNYNEGLFDGYRPLWIHEF